MKKVYLMYPQKKGKIAPEITGETLYREEKMINESPNLSGPLRGTFLGIRPAIWSSIYN